MTTNLPYRYIQKTVIACCLVSMVMGCVKDNRERLFELFYPNNLFEIPAGIGGVFPREVEWSNVATNIDFYLSETGLDTAQIRDINPIDATIISLDGFDFDFAQEISVRICPTSEQDCIPADEVFYIDRLDGRAGDAVRLLPTLRNVRRNLLEQSYKLEILFFLNGTTQVQMNAKLDMTFEAYR
ncbi:MAG: hypothetical protein AAF798_04500 [Bacteroidota bacterium]